MRRTVVVWIVALIVAGLAVERHPVERALGLHHGVRSALTVSKSTPKGPVTGQSQSQGAGSGQASTGGAGGRKSSSVPAVSGTTTPGTDSGKTGSGSTNQTGTSGPSGSGTSTSGSGTSSNGGTTSSSGTGTNSSGSTGKTLPAVSTYPGASTVIGFYQAVGRNALTQAYAMLAPSITQTQSESAFAQVYQGVTGASVESIHLESAANFNYTYQVSVSLTVSGSQTPRTVAGAVGVQNASAGVGSAHWVITSLPNVPAQ